MIHRKWNREIWQSMCYNNCLDEHNALYAAWAEAEKKATEAYAAQIRPAGGDTLAARLREAFLGTETGEAVPFDELKDAVKDRWQRVADAARLRVPFSDAQIERMAEAAHTRRMRDEERTKQWKDLPLFAKDAWRHGIRAALAAGGLEPCAVPEYDPADVALAPTGRVLRDRLVEAEAKIERQRKNLRQMHEAHEQNSLFIERLHNDINTAVSNAMDRLPDAPWKDKTATEAVWLLSLAVGSLRAEVDEDNAAAASVNDLLIKVQNLTAQLASADIELADLRFYQREFAAVSAERDALRERASVPVKGRVDGYDFTEYELDKWMQKELNWSTTPEKAVKIMNYMATHAHAVIDAPAGVPSVEELIGAARSARPDYAIDAAQATAIRDALRARAAVAPTDDQVEALARVLHGTVKDFHSYKDWDESLFQDEYITLARAAIAHLSTRPEGLPTMRDLREIGVHAYLSHDSAKRENAGCMVDPMGAATDAILAALRPWLRVPVGWEMDVHPDQLELYKWVTEPDGGYEYAAQQAIDLCRSRIRPVFECKECAKLRDEVTFWKRENVASNNKMLAARAALEGE